MKRIYKYLIGPIIFTVFLTILLYPFAAYAETCEQWVAKVVSVQGSVEVQKAGETQWQSVKLNDTYCPGDVIRVQERSRADIALVNQPVIRLDQNTTITLGGLIDEGSSLVNLLKGAAHFFSRLPRNLEVHTAFVNAGVEGTEFFIRVEENQTFISIFEGKVLASNEAGKLMLTSGQAAVAEAGKAPVLRVVARPRDAVQWALYYPPVIYVPPEGAEVKEDTNDPRFLANRASLLLAVGRVDEAGADIERALRLDPNYSDAFALQTIIAIVKNEKEKALNLAKKAVEAGPESATARIALSYAQQAGFDLEGARASLEEAVKLEPENALAWARLAELWSSFGNLDKSLEAAQKAVALSPNLSRTQTVLGFAYLTKVKTTEAKGAFEKAIELDQADPLPRLGLGLAKIRDGNLKEGGREIEVAASLDPNNSLIRSYLGKVYFEEKRTGLDVREYAIAKELDPKDPTPWFYSAIAKQTTNRPVEALHDMQKAIELNDNRAVYRSKLQLDSDLAARSASQARIYSDLGFQQRALVEGWTSVNTDPSNFSAHRFLADSYSVLPRHEIARVSELLQSQLLQPTNITPIQPRLGESNLFLISSGGASDTSFNEFNPLFNRDQVTLQASGLYGENDTWSGEGIVSGIYKKLSLSAGYSKFETDGFRENNDQDDDIGNAFVQYELTHKTSIQAEYRYRKTENGDLQQRFFEDDYLANLKEDEEAKTFRIGGRHAFTPGSILLGNFSNQDVVRRESDNPIPEFTSDLKGEDQASTGELQYLLRSKHVNITTGGGYFDINRKDEFLQVLILPPIIIPNPPFPPIIIPVPPNVNDPTLDWDITHTNAYMYSYIKPLESLMITIGASGDFYDQDIDVTVASSGLSEKIEIKEDQFNPKFGITWTPISGTTLRGAVFQTFKRTLITDQTLEPTQVAGFNQFFDDDNGTEALIYGGAIDQKFTNSLYGGAEYTYRDLKFPFFTLTTPTTTVDEAEWDESLFRAYLYWAPINLISLSAEYQYENFDRDKGDYDGAKEVKTHYVPLGINFSHPSGISVTFKGTFVDQQGKFDRRDNPGVLEDGEDSFWIADATISYRFPKRYGFFTIGAKNLFDQEFQFYDTDRDNPRIQPERTVFCSLTLAF